MPTALATSKPAVPASAIYGPQAVPPGYGAVIVGREPEKYDLGAIRAHDQAGGVTFVYIDPVYLEPFGSTATRIHAGSTLMPGAGAKAALIDGALIGRLRDEMHRIRDRFKDVKRLAIFSDDTGPDNTTFYPTRAVQDQAYPRLVDLMEMEREVCDELGMRTQVNANWDGRYAHGYPLRGTHGCGLADFLMSEHHEYAINRVGDFWEAYLRTGQTNLRDAAGRGMHFAICSTLAGAQDALRNPDVAFVALQANGAAYMNPGPKVGTLRDLGIPFGTIDPGPPPSGDDCASTRAERDAALLDLAGARAARDQEMARAIAAEADLAVRTAQRDDALQTAITLQQRIDAARPAIDLAKRALDGP